MSVQTPTSDGSTPGAQMPPVPPSPMPAPEPEPVPPRPQPGAPVPLDPSPTDELPDPQAAADQRR